jgi:hypothetical protein
LYRTLYPQFLSPALLSEAHTTPTAHFTPLPSATPTSFADDHLRRKRARFDDDMEIKKDTRWVDTATRLIKDGEQDTILDFTLKKLAIHTPVRQRDQDDPITSSAKTTTIPTVSTKSPRT